MNKFEKGQLARLYDIFILGPLLIYFATKNKNETLLYSFIVTSGITTITYNGYNFLGNVLNIPGMETNDYYHAIFFVFVFAIVYFSARKSL